MDNDNSKYINSIARAIEILNMYTSGSTYLGISQISKKLNLHKTTVFKIVKTLEREGWLVQNPESSLYKLGINILEIASAVSRTYNNRDIIVEEMKELAKKVNEDVILSILNNMEGLCIEKIDSVNKLIVSSKVGHTMPIHRGASGKILLAYQENNVINEVINKLSEKITDDILVNKENLIQNLAKIKKQGYVITTEECDEGVRGIAVPILDKNGRLLYGLSIAGPINRIEEKGTDLIKDYLVESSLKISKKINLLSQQI